MKKLYITLIIYSSAVISADVLTNIDLFSIGYSQIYPLFDSEEFEQSASLEAPTLYFKEPKSKYSIFLTMGTFSLDTYGYSYTPLSFGLRYDIVRHFNKHFIEDLETSLGTYGRFGLNHNGSLTPVAGIYLDGFLPVFYKVGYINKLGIKIFNLSAEYNIIQEKYSFSFSTDLFLLVTGLVMSNIDDDEDDDD